MSNSHKNIVTPGDMLAALIAKAGVTRQEFAARMGVDRNTVYRLLSNERPITAMYALAIEQAHPHPDNLASQWIGAQAAYDLYMAQSGGKKQRKQTEIAQ